MRKLLSIITLTLTFAVVSSFNPSVLASSQENSGVSTEPPTFDETYENLENITTPFGLGKPPKDAVVNLNYNPLTFDGYAQSSTLYTNSHFKGKTTATYSIKNDSQSTLTVKVYKRTWHTFDTKVQTITISPNSTGGGGIFDLEPDALYYLTFEAPSNFSGSVY